MALSSPLIAYVGNRVILHQRRGNFILRRERIRRAQNQIGSAVAQRDGQVRGFAGHVEARGQAHALERLFLDEPLANQLQHGHLLIRPFDLSLALLRQPQIFYVACYTLGSLCHENFSSYFINSRTSRPC